MAYMARNYDNQRRDKPGMPGPGATMTFGSGKSSQGDFPKSNFGITGDTGLAKNSNPINRDRNSNSLLVPLNIKSYPAGGISTSDKSKWNQPFAGSDLKMGYKGGARVSGRQNYDDSQKTTLGFAADSQMTVAEPSSYGSQNCSYNDSQASILTDEAIPSQHRLLPNHPPSSQTSNPGMRSFERSDQPGSSRAQTPISSGLSRGLLQEHRPPKAPTWNPNLIKRAASPVFEALRNMDNATNSPKSTTSTPPSLDTVVSLLRTTNVEPLVRDLAREIEGRFELLRTQIREGKEDGQIIELIRDQEKNILHAVQQTEDSLKAMQDHQIQIAERLARIESKIDDNVSEWKEWVADQNAKGGGWNCGQQLQFNQPLFCDQQHRLNLPSMPEEDSFDIFQDVGSKARVMADKRICKIQRKVEAKRRRIQAGP